MRSVLSRTLSVLLAEKQSSFYELPWKNSAFYGLLQEERGVGIGGQEKVRKTLHLRSSQNPSVQSSQHCSTLGCPVQSSTNRWKLFLQCLPGPVSAADFHYRSPPGSGQPTLHICMKTSSSATEASASYLPKKMVSTGDFLKNFQQENTGVIWCMSLWADF